jgi:hypothetical protein
MKKTDPPSTKKKLKWSKGFLNNKGSNKVPATKLKGTPQGSSASSSKLYKNRREREGTGFTHPGKI